MLVCDGTAMSAAYSQTQYWQTASRGVTSKVCDLGQTLLENWGGRWVLSAGGALLLGSGTQRAAVAIPSMLAPRVRATPSTSNCKAQMRVIIKAKTSNFLTTVYYCHGSIAVKSLFPCASHSRSG